MDAVRQSISNKITHIKHDNTTQATPQRRVALSLQNLLPEDPVPWDFNCPPLLASVQTSTRDHSASHTFPPFPCWPQFPLRGRRVQFSFSEGKTFYTASRNRHRRFSAAHHRIHGSNLEKDKPTPPQRGTLGTASAVNEECNAPPSTPTTPLKGRGARGRRLRRRLYRQWRRLSRGTIRPEVPGNALARGGLPLKAVQRYKKEAGNNAKAFRKLVLAPKSNRDKHSVHTTTPPVEYGTSFRLGTQNVQGMAEPRRSFSSTKQCWDL